MQTVTNLPRERAEILRELNTDIAAHLIWVFRADKIKQLQAAEAWLANDRRKNELAP